MILPSDTPETVQQITSDAVTKTRLFFSPDSPLKNAESFGGRPYERRVQQEQMAYAVADALEGGHHLCVEAPTGVGKSFAYLVPAIFHALSMHKSVLITTETINLQEQLVYKDLPLLRDILNLNFTFVLAKGRANYLCKRRLAMVRGEHRGEYLPLSTLSTEADKLNDWARETEDGSRSEVPFRLDPLLWNSVCCETSTCAMKKCAFHSTCFYWKARHLWDKADLVVANHALFFTDLKIRELEQQESCPLPPYCAVVFDEAHTLEDNAANHLGIHVNSGGVKHLLNRLFNPVSGRGLLTRPGADTLSMRGQVSRLHDAAGLFFDQFSEGLSKSPEQCMRINRPGSYENPMSSMFMDLERMLGDYLGDDTDEKDNGHKLEVSSQMNRVTAIRQEIDAFVGMDYADHVYWAEGSNDQTGLNRNVELASAPLNVAQILYETLFSRDVPVILTSATLAVRDSLDYFVQRIGFARGEGLILDSPFDYEKQVKLFVSKNMPQPNEKNYSDASVEQIKEFVTRTDGRAFVLFTSYSMLKYCAGKLESYFLSRGIELLVHGESLSRSAMLREFRKSRKAVIFGATSFWTGVDVPGDALSNVIIAKLPFSVPTHPLIAARCDRIREMGGEPFRDYSIPDAVLKFRQGVGRLIRSKTDQGIIVVLDPRIVSKQYGKSFLYSIPPCPIEYF